MKNNKLIKIIAGFAFIVVLLAILTPKNAPEASTTQTPAQQTQNIQYGEFQMKFMQLIKEYSEKYQKAENELQKSALITERQKQFEKLPGKPENIKGWIGVLENFGTNGDGHAFVTISLSPDLLTISTWNNSFSDIGDRTLIKQTSQIYPKLAQMKVGNVVRFSGKLKPLKNMTEDGKMTTPDFLFLFSDIEKIGDSASR